MRVGAEKWTRCVYGMDGRFVGLVRAGSAVRSEDDGCGVVRDVGELSG